MTVARKINPVLDAGGSLEICRGQTLGSLFFEPSTRTSSSFQAAMLRLGGNVISLTGETSSAKKGESIEDSVRTVEQYTDILAIRHPEVGSVSRAANVASVPVINAGDGAGEHPSQALLDCFTIMQELKRDTLDGITVTFVGDLRNGRTVHSLSQLLAVYDDVKINYVAPEALQFPEAMMTSIDSCGVKQSRCSNWDSVMADTDVLYMTRVQQERFSSPEEYERVKGVYVLRPESLAPAKPAGEMVVLHPLPRVDEIETTVDADPRAAYFRQVRYGLTTRMALIAICLGKDRLVRPSN